MKSYHLSTFTLLSTNHRLFLNRIIFLAVKIRNKYLTLVSNISEASTDKTIRNMLLIAVFSFSLSIDFCYFGTQYDERHKLYPEVNPNTCTLSEYYGARWQRIGAALFYLCLGSLLAIPIHLRRIEQAKHFDTLSIYKTGSQG